ncbi:hypothetical protein [uncultured Oxalicibacterium sp.]|uniref:hypothetical protein n=1 Tax=uncultured Oxalicibacterium sp. TaxID=1168540 RepID=UPI0025EAF79F|nr:hypothetical protein [uncultured Oxalicibacterium sp.]
MNIPLAKTSVEQQRRYRDAATGFFGKGLISSPVIFPSESAASGVSHNFPVVAMTPLCTADAIDLYS